MRCALPLLLLFPTVSFAQSTEAIDAVERKLERQRTAKWILEQEAPAGGFYLAPQDPRADSAPRASLRATNGAVRALKYLGFPLLKTEKEKHAKFVLSYYDPKTGGFAELGGKTDVTITSIGIMAAAELDIPHEKYARAMDYLKENARMFEEIRIAAAAIEAWGVKDCPFDIKEWLKPLFDYSNTLIDSNAKEGGARQLASFNATLLRLNHVVNTQVLGSLQAGQRDDGGWGKKGEKASDIESTYRVMRCFMLLGRGKTNKAFWQPKDLNAVRKFVESHRNKDNGYATKPGDKSNMSGAYFAAIISMWLDEMEKK